MLPLKLLKLMYKLQPIRVTVLRSCKNIPIVDSPLQKGSQVMLPRVIAEALESYGVVEIAENIVSYQDLAKTKFSHMQQRGTLPRVEDFFYIKIKNSIEKLLAKAKFEGDIVLLRNIEKMRSDFLDISNIRISTIFRAFQLGGVDILEKNCTIEEKILMNAIRSMYDRWVKEYIELSHGQ